MVCFCAGLAHIFFIFTRYICDRNIANIRYFHIVYLPFPNPVYDVTGPAVQLSLKLWKHTHTHRERESRERVALMCAEGLGRSGQARAQSQKPERCVRYVTLLFPPEVGVYGGCMKTMCGGDTDTHPADGFTHSITACYRWVVPGLSSTRGCDGIWVYYRLRNTRIKE